MPVMSHKIITLLLLVLLFITLLQGQKGWSSESSGFTRLDSSVQESLQGLFSVENEAAAEATFGPIFYQSIH